MKYRYRLGSRKYETEATVTAVILLVPTFVALFFLFIYPVIQIFFYTKPMN